MKKPKLTIDQILTIFINDEHKKLAKADPDKRFTRGIIHGRIEALEEMKQLLAK
jgi:hypothetical protein